MTVQSTLPLYNTHRGYTDRDEEANFNWNNRTHRYTNNILKRRYPRSKIKCQGSHCKHCVPVDYGLAIIEAESDV